MDKRVDELTAEEISELIRFSDDPDDAARHFLLYGNDEQEEAAIESMIPFEYGSNAKYGIEGHHGLCWRMVYSGPIPTRAQREEFQADPRTKWQPVPAHYRIKTV